GGDGKGGVEEGPRRHATARRAPADDTRAPAHPAAGRWQVALRLRGPRLLQVPVRRDRDRVRDVQDAGEAAGRGDGAPRGARGGERPGRQVAGARARVRAALPYPGAGPPADGTRRRFDRADAPAAATTAG